jgi:peroxiredoxin
MFQIGEYVPWYNVQSTVGSMVQLHALAGRYVVLCFFESTANPFSRRILDDIQRHGERFGGESIVFFGVSADPKDANLRPGREQGIYFCDATRELSRVHEVVSNDGTQYKPQTIILDPMLRVASVLPFDGDPESYVPRLLAILNAFPPLQTLPGYAPIIVLPNVFDAEFCRTLIRLYEQHGGHDLGMMMDVGGNTARHIDPRIKCRLDHEMIDQEVMQAACYRLGRSLVPEVRRAFQFNATRVERHIVACYDSALGGHFKAHRDNLTAATAHRKFAVTINLNAEDYEGGDLCFPEYGSRLYRCPTGGAVVFSCTLLHEAKPVTRGRRYAYLPFLYDEEGFQRFQQGRAPSGYFP